jgi:hypothetical protein
MKIDDSFAKGLPTLPIARRRRAFTLAQISDLSDFSRHFAPAIQRSLIGSSRPTGISDTTKRVLESGIKVVEKIRQNGPEVPLSNEEAAAYESVVLIYDRPALLVQNDKCAAAAKPWDVLLTAADAAISARLPKAGRIEIAIGDSVREVASGFVVGDGLIMTNRHVVEVIAVADRSDPTKWQVRSNLRPQINFKGEYLVNDTSRVFLLDTESPALTHPKYDLGLLRIRKESTSTPASAAPPPLKLAGTASDLKSNQNIYVVGYPAADNQNRIPKAVLDDIFGGIFEVKRLAPGTVAANWEDQGVFAHDCSTLGGNSGSFVMDFETELVTGLHFQGSYLKANYAIWLWPLKDYLVEHGVQFD